MKKTEVTLKKTCTFLLFVVSVWGLLVPYSHGQAYPTKSIEMIVPYGPGAPMDIMSRLVAETAPKYLGQPLVVVNKIGAGGALGAAEVIGAKPDGYKLVCLTTVFFALTTKTQKIPFDPNQLSPLANFIEYKSGLVVRGDSPWRSFNEMLDYAKKNPGKLRWAHSGRGIQEHIAGLSIFKKARVETLDIPYTGGVPTKVVALLGGHIDASMMTYGTIKDHVKAGKMRFVAVINDRRYSDSDLINVPTVVELGFPETATLKVYSGFFVHKDTPGEIKKFLVDTFKKIYEDPEFKKVFEALGDEPVYGKPEFVKDAIEKAEGVSVPLLKELGLLVGK